MIFNVDSAEALHDAMQKWQPEDFEKAIAWLFNQANDAQLLELANFACTLRDRIYGRRIFMRALLEFTSFCQCNCYYCGLRSEHRQLERYRLTESEIIESCKNGYTLGFRTFVLQGGEDLYFTEERMVHLIKQIKATCKGSAVTLSVGEKSAATYQQYFDAGADRFLLRHETADASHYAQLHPSNQTYEQRMRCLKDLKRIGYQTGAGFMVDSPGQTIKTLAKDLMFLRTFQPAMCGIGPFVAHQQTPFAQFKNGSAKHTLILLSLIRILLPKILLPSTTALATIHENGAIEGFNAGANVLMPNITPILKREHYTLYDHKKNSGTEGAETFLQTCRMIEAEGYIADTRRGDHIDYC